jgi:molybdopterin-guanine dinucleotide biosynthesis adapter protein
MARLFGIAGRSGQGKTTLIEALLAHFGSQGRVVNVIKHCHHKLDLEPPHKNSARFRAAGAGEVLVVSPTSWAILHDGPEPSFDAMFARLSPADLTLVEGYTSADIPRLEVVRSGSGCEVLYPRDPRIIAIASDMAPDTLDTRLPVLALDDVSAIAAFIAKTVGGLTAGAGQADNRA